MHVAQVICMLQIACSSLLSPISHLPTTLDYISLIFFYLPRGATVFTHSREFWPLCATLCNLCNSSHNLGKCCLLSRKLIFQVGRYLFGEWKLVMSS